MPTEEKIKCTLNTIIFQKDDFIIASFDLVDIDDDKKQKNKESKEKYFQELADWKRKSNFDFDPFEDYSFKTNNTIKAKGTIVSPQQGVTYTLSGVWENHPRYGKSLKINDYEVEMPNNAEDIVTYLSDYGIGIGPITARRIVDLFGVDTLRVIKETPIEELKEKIGDRRFRQTSVLEKLKEKLIEIENGEQRYLQSKSVFKNTNLGKRTIDKILEAFKGSFVDVIKSNPYALIDDDRFSGVGFKTAEQIAVNVKFDLNSDLRFQSAIIFTMQEFVQNGSCFIKEDVLENLINSRYNLDRKRVKECFNKLVENKKLVIDEEKVYLQNIWYYEDFVAKKIVELSKQECRLIAEEVDLSLLHEDQKTAFEIVKNNNFTIVGGSAGTGKSYLLSSILKAYEKYDCLCVSPTGKSAYRMTELTGKKASTIHRALMPMKNPETGNFEFTITKDNPLSCDMLICDEVSMLSLDIAYYLLSAVENKTKVLFLGDFQQLPSVSYGNVLYDIINSNVIPVTELQTVKRQNPGNIILNCNRVKNGQDIIRDNSESSDFFLISKIKDEDIIEEIISLVTGRLEKKFNKNLTIEDWQIISPHNTRTALSCENLNKICQEKLNSYSPYIWKTAFKENDKVICKKNNYNYDPPLLNGSIGIMLRGVEEYNEKEQLTKYFEIKFSDRNENILVPIEEHNIKLAYCLTVHSYQGSQVPVVIMPIISSFSPLLMQKCLFYTGISRPEKCLIIVGHLGEISKIINRNYVSNRMTYLSERLKCYDKEIEVM